MRTSGKVKWFNAKKGFGFIEPDDGSGDVFVHQSGIEMEGYRELQADQRVSFVFGEDRRGRLKAEKVKVEG